MTITGPPRTRVAPKDPKEESQALLKEARRRRRLRWLGGGRHRGWCRAHSPSVSSMEGAPLAHRRSTQLALHAARRPPSRPGPRRRPEPSSTALKRWPPMRTATSSSPTRDRTRYWSDFRLATVMPFAGDGHAGFGGDTGPAVAAELNVPQGIAVGSNGMVYVADSGNNLDPGHCAGRSDHHSGRGARSERVVPRAVEQPLCCRRESASSRSRPTGRSPRSFR